MVVTRNYSKDSEFRTPDVKSWVEKRRKSFMEKDRKAKFQDCRQKLSDVKVFKVIRINPLIK